MGDVLWLRITNLPDSVFFHIALNFLPQAFQFAMFGLELLLLRLKHRNHVQANLHLLLLAEFDLPRGALLRRQLLIPRFFLRTDHTIESAGRISKNFTAEQVRKFALMRVMKSLF